MTIGICIATYRRPRGLRTLLRSLSPVASACNPADRFIVVVCDNDPEASARAIVSAEVAGCSWEIRYVVEPRRGIAQARNAAVRASAPCSFLAFIDDDEIPDAQWLQQLLLTQQQFDADVVAGPVLPSFHPHAPRWARVGGFYQRGRYRTGQSIAKAVTGNVLLRSSVFAGLGGFNERFGLTGGEDSQFFLRAAGAGYRMVWCDEALVHEPVDENRTTLKWLIRRAYQGGSNQARVEMTLSAPRRAGLVRALKGAVHMGHSIVRLPFSPLAGTAGVVREFHRFALGLGMVGGACGITLEPYRNTR